MKKRFTAFVLTIGMLINQSTGMVSAAENGKNAYGHTVTYEPATQLYTGGEPIRFFDSQITDWGSLSDTVTRNEANSIRWLSENGYLLNHFGTKYNPNEYTPGCFNSKGEWQTQLKGPTNVSKYYANVRFGNLADEDQRKNGNISNIYDKGDLQYFFSWKVKTVQTRWGLTGKSNDYGKTLALGEWTESFGGGWKKHNTLGDGPNLFNSSAWKPAKKLQYIGFVGISDKDSRVDSYLSGAMLVGRDIKGPSISSVRVTSDIDGNNEIENGAITLDTIDKLNDRTVYFQVQWDEPVVFRNMTKADIEKLSLSIETLGIDGTSGIIAEAPFLKFAPSKNDSKPIMVFEYKIADPYTDTSSVTQERGYFYKFSKVTVSEKENSQIWNNIYDISGNKFAADENGSQPASKVVAAISGSTYVDLMPFGIENIRMAKEQNDDSAFIKAGGLLGVTLELNKAVKSDTSLMNLPAITLNIKDENGKYITIKPDENELVRKYRVKDGWKDYGYFYNNSERIKPVMISADQRSISYYVQLIPGYTMDGNSIKIKAVSSDKQAVKDSSGYSFMNYELSNNLLTPTDIPPGAESKKSEYSISPDKQYKFDFDTPIMELSAKDEGEGIISITASIEDKSIEGCYVAFAATVNGKANDNAISYQVSTNESYDDAKWSKDESDSMTAAFGSPIINGKTYGFIKLPENCEASKIAISAVVTDEAENSASTQTEIPLNFDTLAPSIKLSVKDETISVNITDMADDVTYSYGFSEDENAEPTYTEVHGKIGTITAPDLPAGNEVYTRVLWIKAKDSHGNESKITKLPIKYDRTYTEINITSADTDRQYLMGEYPNVGFDVKNATMYWCIWVEKPANTSDTAAYVAENCLADMKARAIDHGTVSRDNDGTLKTFNLRISEITSYSMIDVIDSSTELYADEPVSLNETSRPLMLVIGAEREDGTTLVKTIEFDTFYGAPGASVIQRRFSTNDSKGKRVDYINGAGTAQLLSASNTEYNYPLNTPNLYGFAQSEFTLVPDPITGLDRVDIENSSLTLEKVVYGGTDLNGEEKNRNIVDEWSFSDIGLSNTSYNAVIDIDPKIIDAKYYEIDESGNRNAVRYEFICNMSYKGGVASNKMPITYFAFNNEPSAFICDTQYSTDGGSKISDFYGCEKKNVEAVFDKDGNDITSTVPVYTTQVYSVGSDPGFYIRFSANGWVYDSYSDMVFYNSPVINTTGTDNTAKMVMHIGTDPKNLSDVVQFKYLENSGIISECYDINKYFSEDENVLSEVKLYYSFEYPERGTISPTYVMKIRRDNVGPIFDISVSETERLTNEVLVKLNGVYDVQKASDGTIVIDTTEEELLANYFVFDAWREAAEDEDISGISEENIDYSGYYDEETDTYIPKTYVKMQPESDGAYHFTSNGYINIDAEDMAGNTCSMALINGEVYDFGRVDFNRYYINNVSNVPPRFVSEPTFDEGDRNFTLSAKADETVKNVYLKFDKAYSQLLSENDSEDSGLYSVQNVPGIISGGYDSETGQISADIYVKHSETIPLSAVTVIIENNTGNKTEYTYNFTSPIYGSSAEITNTKNANGYPVYNYGKTLDFSVPVKLVGTDGKYSDSHANIAVYSDGITQIEYTDLFGESKTENVYADIFGTAFNHVLIFTANGNEITPQTPTASDIKVKIDTSMTKNLSVDGGKTEFTFSENGTIKYSLTNSELGQTREFNIPIINIDKTAPEAIISFNAESETDIETGKQKIYSATYSIEGFSEEGVTLIPSADGAAPSSVTFEYGSSDKEYTFRFRDAAGNEGSYTVDVSDIAFTQRTDNKITGYRLTYTTPDENGFRTIGQFGTNDKITNVEPLNKAVSVKIEALNQNGETVSSSISVNGNLPQGTAVYAKEKFVMFTTESSEERIVNLTLAGTGSENSINIYVVLPANTIDLTAPSGTVYYKPDGSSIKAYLVTNDTDLAENGVYVTGTKADGTAFELKRDENGYYTELDMNGAGRFIMTDKAGNVGTVAIAVLTIDKEPPQIISEGWQSLADAKTAEEIAKLLATPTNNTIKLFMTFNEQLSGAEVKAFKSMGEAEELRPTDEYVTAAANGTTLTVEFMQNCRAKLTVYDLRGNALTLWRPEDGPITVIDRDVPKLAEGYPNRVFEKENNVVKIEYVFADGEEVMLLQKHEDGYKNKHIVTVSENGTQIFNFADRAGNVFSDYPVISEIDDLAPSIKMNMDFVGNGSELSGNDSYMAGNFYTSKDVRILLNITDTTADEISVTAETKSGTKITVKKENISINDKSYNYNFVVAENGSYKITAKDKWGHENSVETNISVIDKTAPTIKLGSNTVVINLGISEENAKSKILEAITAVDLQSGAESPMGDKGEGLKNTTQGVKISTDISKVRLDKEGTYTAKITAEDRLGNISEKDLTVTVLKDMYTFSINGSIIYANDVFTSEKGRIQLNGSSKTAKYYYAKGYKTAAQMKYATGFDVNEGFDALQNGYYTILAQESDRKMYLLYVYIY